MHTEGQIVALGLAAAATWGAADFSGGLAARRVAPPFVILIAHGLTLAILLAIVFLHHDPAPRHLFPGLLSGLVGAVGLMALYGALARGAMGLTAAISGVLTAILPVAVSWVHEGHAGSVKLSGFAVALVAIWLLAYTPGESGIPPERDRSWLWMAVTAGLCFGGMLILMRVAAAESVVWALTLTRLASTAVGAAGSLIIALRWRAKKSGHTRKTLWPRALLLAALAGLFDTTGNWLYTLTSLAGRLDVAAVLASLYPGMTIVLAAVLLKEHARRSQWIGMGLAVAAVALIAA